MCFKKECLYQPYPCFFFLLWFGFCGCNNISLMDLFRNNWTTKHSLNTKQVLEPLNTLFPLILRHGGHYSYFPAEEIDLPRITQNPGFYRLCPPSQPLLSRTEFVPAFLCLLLVHRPCQRLLHWSTMDFKVIWLRGAWSAHPSPLQRCGIRRYCHSLVRELESVCHLPRKQNLADRHICLPRWDNCHPPWADKQEIWCWWSHEPPAVSPQTSGLQGGDIPHAISPLSPSPPSHSLPLSYLKNQ